MESRIILTLPPVVLVGPRPVFWLFSGGLFGPILGAYLAAYLAAYRGPIWPHIGGLFGRISAALHRRIQGESRGNTARPPSKIYIPPIFFFALNPLTINHLQGPLEWMLHFFASKVWN